MSPPREDKNACLGLKRLLPWTDYNDGVNKDIIFLNFEGPCKCWGHAGMAVHVAIF